VIGCENVIFIAMRHKNPNNHFEIIKRYFLVFDLYQFLKLYILLKIYVRIFVFQVITILINQVNLNWLKKILVTILTAKVIFSNRS